MIAWTRPSFTSPTSAICPSVGIALSQHFSYEGRGCPCFSRVQTPCFPLKSGMPGVGRESGSSSGGCGRSSGGKAGAAAVCKRSDRVQPAGGMFVTRPIAEPFQSQPKPNMCHREERKERGADPREKVFDYRQFIRVSPCGAPHAKAASRFPTG